MLAKQREKDLNRRAQRHVHSIAARVEPGKVREKIDQFKDSRHPRGKHDTQTATDEAQRRKRSAQTPEQASIKA